MRTPRRISGTTRAPAVCVRVRPAIRDPGNFYEYLRTLRKEGAHGAAFAYKTVNTEVHVLGHEAGHGHGAARRC